MASHDSAPTRDGTPALTCLEAGSRISEWSVDHMQAKDMSLNSSPLRVPSSRSFYIFDTRKLFSLVGLRKRSPYNLPARLLPSYSYPLVCSCLQCPVRPIPDRCLSRSFKSNHPAVGNKFDNSFSRRESFFSHDRNLHDASSRRRAVFTWVGTQNGFHHGASCRINTAAPFFPSAPCHQSIRPASGLDLAQENRGPTGPAHRHHGRRR